MRNVTLSVLAIVSALLSLAWQPPQPASGGAEPPNNVAPAAWAATASASADVIIRAPGYPDLSPARSLATKEAKTRFVFEALARFADQAQAGLRQALRLRKVAYQVLWISNSVAVHADRATLEWLSARPDVARIDLDAQSRGIEVGLGEPDDLKALIQNPQNIEWGVARVNAPQVWALGYRGQGIVVADLDTGVQWDHPALRATYRGWNGSAASHTYNWYDAAYDQPGDVRAPAPADDNGHGTHTTGTMVGADGVNQIGVAPEARWIACRNMRAGYGSVSRYVLCFQFALAPTDANGQNPDPSRAADITNNSWSCWGGAPWFEQGCAAPTALLSATQALNDAGIMVVSAAGNEGSGCSTITYAPGMYDQSFTAGATSSDAANSIAAFSSRGPSVFSGHVKPDVVAPGNGVNSSVPGDSYGMSSGTSMATPHVAGVVALLWSAAPGLRGDIAETTAILRRTARPLTTAEACGGVPGSSVPNNTYGYGLIDARAAVSEALAVVPDIFVPAVQPFNGHITATVFVTNMSNVLRTNVAFSLTLPMSVSGAAPGQAFSWWVGNLASRTAISRTVVFTAERAGLITFNDYSASYDGLVSRRSIAGAPVSTFVYTHFLHLIRVMRS